MLIKQNKEITHCSWLNSFCNFNKDESLIYTVKYAMLFYICLLY